MRCDRVGGSGALWLEKCVRICVCISMVLDNVMCSICGFICVAVAWCFAHRFDTCLCFVLQSSVCQASLPLLRGNLKSINFCRVCGDAYAVWMA